MNSAVYDKIKELISETGVLGVLALREQDGAASPHMFTSVVDTTGLALEPKWPLAKTAWRMARDLPDGKSIGLVCRGCDMRALEELVKAGQLRPGAVRAIGVSCSADQAEACLCETPFPPGGEPAAGVDPLAAPDLKRLCFEPGRLELWRENFKRCIKCYGCRNSCPICVCPSCKLEEDGYVTSGTVPPDPLAFHLIRAMHLADRCVGCGACQESCPAGLPLLSLHLAVRRALRDRTSYISGVAAISPLLSAGKEEGPVGSAAPIWEDTLKGCREGGEHAG